jgi:hypothetical protein
MPPRERTLSMYGQPSEIAPLEWDWVDQELAASGAYWVIAIGGGRYPHPRPVWGVWHGEQLNLSVGSPVLQRALSAGSAVSVHLESGTDVVILEGDIAGSTTAPEVIDAYDRKYEWSYDANEYGPLTIVTPTTILAWRASGWAGRDSFQQTGCWEFRS